MQPSTEQSAQILKSAKESLNKLDIPFCLFLGTSLGIYRDGNFCPGDTDDIDIAVDAKYYPRLGEIVKALKMEHVIDWIPEDKLCPESSFKHWWIPRKCYTKIDIFFINEIDGKKAWRFYLDESGRKYLTKTFDKKHFETFDKVVFFGEEYNIPGHIEEYLEANYGDWKTPIHRDNWVWYKDNKCYEV